MSPGVDSVADADQWLHGAALERSAVLFVVGRVEAALMAALDRRGWRGQIIALDVTGHDAPTEVRGVTGLRGPSFEGLDRAVLAVEPDAEQPVIVGDPTLLRTRRDDVVGATRLVMKAWFGARANQEARKRFAGPYLLNTLRNLLAIAAEGDAGVLVGGFERVPVIVAAAGPSLDHAMSAVARLRDRALVIAVDTAARPLLGAGVVPDIVVALDPSEANAGHLLDLPASPGTWLVAEGSLDPHALAAFRGRALVFRVADHHPWPWVRSLGLDRRPLRAWGSVLTTAFDLALQMGCDPIVMVGADLAFTDGRPYARGTTFEEEWRRAESWGQSLAASWAERVGAWPETREPGVDGLLVHTAPHLRAFRDWIAAEASRAKGRTVVNATGGGLLVGDAILQRSLADALEGAPPMRPDVRTRLGTLAGARRAPAASPTALPSADLVQTWTTWGGISAESIQTALATPPISVGPPRVEPAPSEPPPPPVDRDALYLAELACAGAVRSIALERPDQDLLGSLRELTIGLSGDDAVVIIDALGLGMGLPVRAAVDALLCERPDLCLEDRRFTDHASRVTVLRGDAVRRARPAVEADADKWDQAHAATAARLTAHLVRELQPQSVVDIGCGAGYWLEALQALGVTDVLGVSARTTSLASWTGPARRFDVCLCLETASRLPPGAHDAVIATCARLSDVVVFSARLPGAPDGSPFDRPLPYWATLFWRHGYVLDDRLRQAIERHTPFPATIYDLLLVFRRRVAPPTDGADAPEPQRVLGEIALAAAARLHDLYTQKIWWAVAALDRQSDRLPAVELPQPRLVTWVIPPGRLASAPGGARILRLRSEAARWHVTHQAAALRVSEDGHRLTEVPWASCSSAAAGTWARWRDEILIRSSDGSDPRLSGRAYGLVVPAHVAWAESQPLAETLANGL